ncbi:MAG TPA: beta-L-arabinofuranosidase domain-containing protein [Candidatus Sulfotelmatobacter sp.]|nr:beta-L-arabinofuranosidase domain-containing protein [Candidatus Sulfotelmatobacter sp.]
MSSLSLFSRRKFLESAAVAAIAGAVSKSSRSFASSVDIRASRVLGEFGYGDVSIDSPIHEEQFRQTHAVLMGLDDDALMKPFRAMAGQSAPGVDLGGWYRYDPDYDWHTFDAGFAPSATFGQWVSALARAYAITGSQAAKEKVLRLNRLYAQTISGDFYEKNRFPAYCYDKLVCGLIDSYKYAGDPLAWEILAKTTDTAMPHLPGHAVEHGTSWRPGKDVSWTWDESYTMPENLFLANQRGAGDRYREIGVQYLNEPFYERLARGENDLKGRHAYSHVNCLCSAMQAYLTLGNENYLQAAKNGFDMVLAQSFATGGWGPDELLRATGSADVYDSLTNMHHSFETPCGSYAHFKLTRYLLRVTRDPRYGDSMERVMYNTILGALPLEADGQSFYYSDYTFKGKKEYSEHRWPCCSGTMPQVVADYRINTYLRDGRDVFVNLYIPSTVRWTLDGAQISLAQKGDYPYGPHVTFEVNAPKKVSFAVNLRIPTWAEGASVSVNGKRKPAVAGAFARVEREWKSGDRIELELPTKTRLEPLDSTHADIVALLSGPLVLFAIGDSQVPVTRTQLLAAKAMRSQSWQVETTGGVLNLLPWTAIEDQPYTTYLRVT